MPCTDGGYSEMMEQRENAEKMAALSTKVNELTAMLCGFARLLESRKELNSAIETIDWTEVGVSKESFQKWWKAHKAADGRRRAHEERTKKEAAAKAEIAAVLEEFGQKIIQKGIGALSEFQLKYFVENGATDRKWSQLVGNIVMNMGKARG